MVLSSPLRVSDYIISPGFYPLVFQKEFEQLMIKDKGYEEEEAGPLLWGQSQPMLNHPRPLSLLTAPSTRKCPPYISESGK